jgi:hypothetical protein
LTGVELPASRVNRLLTPYAGDGSPSKAASPNNHAAVSRLRALIANLKEGAAFCKRLGASLKQVQVLLASSQAGVVHDAIVFLTMCK